MATAQQKVGVKGHFLRKKTPQGTKNKPLGHEKFKIGMAHVASGVT
jgi:hypothetical protein